MMDTNTFWMLRGTFAEKLAKLASITDEYKTAIIVDHEYNDFLRSRADYREAEADPHGHGKRVPYIGWFYRHLEFSSRQIPIGDCGSYIGFMANNKWYYPERLLTEEEFEKVMSIIDEAMALNEQGGLLTTIVDTTNAKLDELWDYLQTLSVAETANAQ